MTKAKEKLISLKNSLIHLNHQESLSKLTIILIIALDIFILTTVFSGLEDHTRQLTSVNQFAPYQCKKTFINNPISKLKSLDRLTDLVTNDYVREKSKSTQYSDYYYNSNIYFDKNINKTHPICQSFFHNIKTIAQNKTLKKVLTKRLDLSTKITQLQQAFNKQKNTYDTGLLEKIANKTNTIITNKAEFYKAQLALKNAKITNIDNELKTHPLIKSFIALVITKHKRTLSNDLQKFKFWYKFKEWLWQLLFLLPIFGFLYFWNSKTLKRKETIQTLISTHLLVVVSIPILIQTYSFLMSIIPHIFLKKLFQFLENLYLVGIWHYLVIVFIIILSIFIILLIHKKLSNLERTYQQRLKKSNCYACNKKLPNNANHCIFCGIKQTEFCSVCHSDTYLGGDYCQNCGYTKKPITTNNV